MYSINSRNSDINRAIAFHYIVSREYLLSVIIPDIAENIREYLARLFAGEYWLDGEHSHKVHLLSFETISSCPLYNAEHLRDYSTVEIEDKATRDLMLVATIMRRYPIAHRIDMVVIIETEGFIMFGSHLHNINARLQERGRCEIIYRHLRYIQQLLLVDLYDYFGGKLHRGLSARITFLVNHVKARLDMFQPD